MRHCPTTLRRCAGAKSCSRKKYNVSLPRSRMAAARFSRARDLDSRAGAQRNRKPPAFGECNLDRWSNARDSSVYREKGISELRCLLNRDTTLAKRELHSHLSEIRMTPAEKAKNGTM